ncbi:MAG: zinc-dependent metalloprotease [Phycisphaerales bacterium]|nr:zinc-dependent metalloprotease [Phycisphaerales bacterium]
MLARRCRRFAVMATVITAMIVVSTKAQAEAKASKKAPKPTKKKSKPDFPPFDEAMKDYTKVPTGDPPFFNLWYNKKKDSLRAQIPGSLIGKKFLIAASMSGGPVATGFQMGHFLAYFEKMNKNLVLMRVDPRYVEEGTKPVADVIKRSYGNDLILEKIRIVTKKGGDCIIDLDSLFKSDFLNVGRMGGGSVNSGLSKWAKYKAFPNNVELSVDLAMMRGGTGKRTQFHYSLSEIPKSASGYKPRAADSRIGYFMTVRKDWSKDHNAPTLFNRYINRWRLEKRDPTAEFSAPKNPIIWYIEKTVPLKYRRWVKEGILEWNKAFEKCGFLDAIEVIQQEDYDERTKHLDPEDVRYNFFRWIVTGRGFAMGPSRAHPLTGQIFDADIVFDDAMVRIYVSRYDRLTGSEESWSAHNPYLKEFYQSNPQWTYRSPRELLLPNLKVKHDPDEIFYNNLIRHMHEQGHPMCECASGMAHQMQFARLAFEAKGLGRDSDEFIGQIIKEIVMHEVGHCLGLRHNFKASAWLPMNEIGESNEANEANVGSVMDYNPPIVAPRGEEQASFTTRSIGPYDYWAIEYGYRPVGKPYKGEKEMLGKIAGRVAEAGLDYGTDEDTFGFISPDPLSNRFDMGRDVINYAKWQIKLADSLLDDIKTWAVKDGESYVKFRRAFTSIMSQRASAAYFVARYPGGQIMNRDHKGDPDARPPVELVEPKKQREAVEFVCNKVFAENAYEISPELLNHLAPGRFWHWDSDEFDFFVDFNIHDFVASSQFQCLATLMNPFTVGRIHDNQVKYDGDDVYTLGEHMKSITGAIWSELDENGREGTERKAFVNSFRRNLQRNHLDMLMDMVLREPGGIVPADANAIARLSVSKLSKKIDKVLKKAELDIASEAHLYDVKTRIDKALEAQYSVGRYGAGGGAIFLRPASKDSSEQTVTVLPPR